MMMVVVPFYTSKMGFVLVTIYEKIDKDFYWLDRASVCFGYDVIGRQKRNKLIFIISGCSLFN